MSRWSASVFAISFIASVALAQPAATTNPAAHDVDPAVTAFLAPVQAQSGDNELRQKLIERHNVAVKLLELRLNEYRRGLVPLSEGMAAAGAVAEAKMDLAQSDDERAKVAQQTLDVMKVAEARIEKQVQAGFGSEADLDRTRLARLNAEIELLKLKQPKQSTRDTTAPATTRP